MEQLNVYQVDAFANELFSGNPAAICFLDQWLDDKLMQLIASENNLSETAFLLPVEKGFQIRWFTPAVEVDLCGHATLAAAYVLFTQLDYQEDIVQFHSPRSGKLSVIKQDDILYLDFPTDTLIPIHDDSISAVENGIGVKVLELFKGKTDYIALVENEHQVRNMAPDMESIAALNARGIAVTAKGNEVDFVSRFFAPQSGIPEDPATGSAHTSLIPIWSQKLGKSTFTARQLSQRGGHIFGEFKGDRCLIGGKAQLYMTGTIHLD